MVGNEVMHRHEFNRCDSQRFQILDSGRMRKSCVCSSDLLRKIRMEFRKPLYMCFVNNGLVIGHFWCFIILPVEMVLNNDTFWNKWCGVEVTEAQVFVLISDLVSIKRVIPLNRPGNGFCIG